MIARPSVLCLLLLLPLAVTAAPQPTTSVTPALQRWQLGQESLRNGNADAAIDLYRESLKLDPGLSRNYLSLAAAYSAKGDDNQSLKHLTLYLDKEPDHVQARCHFAEMLLRLGRKDAAQRQFERCAADLQDRSDIGGDKLLHCQSRLMELAEAAQDEYGEHLHRGIGLYLLACERGELPEPDGELAVESLLFRAVDELRAALDERPDEARPCWYLHKAWSRLVQQHPATRWLHAAEDAAPLSFLTAAERRELQKTCHCAVVAQMRK
jgi:tetratricopeptide (TPR) repeat protein